MTDFCRPNYPTALIILVASITLKPYTHPATTIDKCPLSLPHESRDWTEGEPCSLRLQLPRSGFWVRLYSPVEQRESLDWQGTKHYRAAGFLKQGNENLPLPELASPLLFTHSHGGVGKSSDTPFHSGFVSADRSPHFVLQFCVHVVSLNRELHNEECAVIYLHVALLTCHCNTWD